MLDLHNSKQADVDAPPLASGVSAFRACAVIPTYDNPRTIAEVVRKVGALVDEVLVVDDASGPDARREIERLAAAGLCRHLRRETNGGKGAAVKTGFAWARQLGFSHALQVDADGQHDLDDVPAFLRRAREQPDALILGAPRYDHTAPRSRKLAREVTRFWTRFQAGSRIDDPMCGFRVYPLAPLASIRVAGNRMDFDIEVAVRLVWEGVPVINLPTRVRYLSDDAGGVSHFRLFEDNLRISWLHTRLSTLAVLRRVFPWLTKHESPRALTG